MRSVCLDSRLGLGTDQDRRGPIAPAYAETSWSVQAHFGWRTVRVVLGHLGDSFRLSAPELDIVAEGYSIEQAWEQFLVAASEREDAAWLTFDVGATRPDEISCGLDAPEDEDWAEPAVDPGVD